MRSVLSGTRRSRLLLAVVVVLLLAGCSFNVETGPPAEDETGFDGLEETGPDEPNDPDDPDGDGLDTEREEELGTDPNDPDTDGDRLPDGWEVNGETPDGAELPGADPLHKDIYLQLSYAEGVPELTDRERENLRDIWDEMNVSNPDGERGITLHIDDEQPHGGEVDVNRTFTETPEEFLEDQYAEYLPPSRRCVYHGSTFVEVNIREADFLGYSRSTGYESVIAGQLEGRTRDDVVGTYNDRVNSLTHELLHNVVGTLTEGSDPGHVNGAEGWLAGVQSPVENDTEFANRYEHLAPVTSETLSEEGFAEYNNPEACE